VQLFVAGIVPGLLAGFAMMGLCYFYAVRYNWPVEEIFQLGKLWRAFRDAFWALMMPIIILGGIFGGVVTATEGAALAVVGLAHVNQRRQQLAPLAVARRLRLCPEVVYRQVWPHRQPVPRQGQSRSNHLRPAVNIRPVAFDGLGGGHVARANILCQQLQRHSLARPARAREAQPFVGCPMSEAVAGEVPREPGAMLLPVIMALARQPNGGAYCLGM
jgi:hypothetical protein